MRADLDQEPVPVGQQGSNGPLEPHGLPQVAVPVLGVQFGRSRADRGVERHRGRARGQPGEVGQQPLPDGFHVRGVRRVVHRDAAGPVVDGQQHLQRLGVAGHHRRLWTVDRRDGQPVDEPGHLVGRQRHRHHAAAAGQRGQRAAAQRDHPGGVGQRQRAGHARRRDLALAVPDHRVRFDPVRPPDLGQRDHHGEQRRLHHVHPPQRVLVAQHVEQGPVDVRGERDRAVAHPLGEDR